MLDTRLNYQSEMNDMMNQDSKRPRSSRPIWLRKLKACQRTADARSRTCRVGGKGVSESGRPNPHILQHSLAVSALAAGFPAVTVM
jgi:hypothetical protein